MKDPAEPRPASSRQNAPIDVLGELLVAHGELMGGLALQRCLGFRSPRSFQRALVQGHLPIATFPLAGRRGRFARTRDVAAWLATLGESSANPR